ncbi:hypothetical protein [Streptomyces sp. NBC_00102]|uniref:hypothetical protein n=1 Tax=Streptomyces sp. NBC_00102 TaxID=2975652 RepID=UPI002253E588|nr:hypothetical protein [Streptomyces sp. NBC_00102]MCX5398494.1 hypothetical protein [Streptomyces sp. NBC_00102]
MAALLAALRADTLTLTARHPDHTFRTVAARLTLWNAQGIDVTVFRTGLDAVRDRLSSFGLSHMLPLSRMLVGAQSKRAGAFGGFHHPDQGYRHLQMVSVVTMYGPMERDAPESPELALLDLLRAYAHDCIHFGAKRRYVDVDGTPSRVQYGINYRRPNGASYSTPDPQGSPHTRNLGVVMEGAGDREARRITRWAAAQAGIKEPDDPFQRIAFRDCTGTLAAEDVRDHPTGGGGEGATYVRSLIGYERGVNQRYAAFLSEFAAGEENELHELLLSAVISGSASGLSAWLDERHGPGTFAGVFLSPSYFAPAPIRSV